MFLPALTVQYTHWTKPLVEDNRWHLANPRLLWYYTGCHAACQKQPHVRWLVFKTNCSLSALCCYENYGCLGLPRTASFPLTTSHHSRHPVS